MEKLNAYSVTGAAFPLVISGKEFSAYALADVDYTELDGYIQRKVLEISRQLLDSLGPADRAEQLQAGIKAAASSGWGTQEGQRIIMTPEGVLRLGWQMIKKRSTVTFEDFCTLARGKDEQTFRENLQRIEEAYIATNFTDLDFVGKKQNEEAVSQEEKRTA